MLRRELKVGWDKKATENESDQRQKPTDYIYHREAADMCSCFVSAAQSAESTVVRASVPQKEASEGSGLHLHPCHLASCPVGPHNWLLRYWHPFQLSLITLQVSKSFQARE